jgi:hypothetical protein
MPDAPDWIAWHRPYDEPGSYLDRRLRCVQRRVADALRQAPPGPIRILSLCAGQGRDVLEVLPTHPRLGDVHAVLVELDGHNVADARRRAAEAGLSRIEVVEGDAGDTATLEPGVPADVLLVCGVYGNISDADIDATIGHLPELCAPGAVTIWTRHRREPDRTSAIRRRYREVGFEEVAFDVEDGFAFAVGTNRLSIDPPPFVAGRHLFDFIDR